MKHPEARVISEEKSEVTLYSVAEKDFTSRKKLIVILSRIYKYFIKCYNNK